VATESIQVSGLIPATPKEIYTAWLDSTAHSKFTGSIVTVEPHVGGTHTAWNGTITGKTLELIPNRRIVQSWRSTDFPSEAPDSRLEVCLAPRKDGAEITFLHSGIPEGQGHEYEARWLDRYLTPMRQYFKLRAARLAKEKAKAEAKALEAKANPPEKKAPPPKPAAKPNPNAKAKAKAKPKPKAAAKKSAPKKKPKAAKKPAPKKSAKKKAKSR
jgi:uncharacterized protein YndB with AHSA1/START domain